MELIYSLLCILGGSVYIIYLLKRKKEDSNSWDTSMNLRGFAGGIIIVIIGIILFLQNIQ
ncbi:hypothetical protein SAMN04488018_10829 [Myroides marinus]|uniref:Uncharacterized protein n=1 Tax=Myroides marinus TaxID=703342 RepID=A0A1H6V946_9FLAO|nr:hypothetical protein [Myroides marinus]SEI96785.1 hypothetical protein SAMN04488018_10829 [Myroides marinus]